MPDTTLSNVMCYETLLSKQSTSFDWPEFDENTASAMCYTSGTTGNPKGVVYSHRSTLLHALGGSMPDVVAASYKETTLPIVPMFHVNAWGAPYASLMVGTKMVMPGPKMGDGEALQNLIESEKVTFSSGVPTIWLGLLDYLEKTGKTIPTLTRVSVGGAACPRDGWPPVVLLLPVHRGPLHFRQAALGRRDGRGQAGRGRRKEGASTVHCCARAHARHKSRGSDDRARSRTFQVSRAAGGYSIHGLLQPGARRFSAGATRRQPPEGGPVFADHRQGGGPTGIMT